MFLQPAGQWLCGLCTATADKTHLRCSLTAPATTIADPSESDDPFCICGHEGLGQMVSCDNARCLVQWFHFACVGITAEVNSVHFDALYLFCFQFC